MFTKKIIHTLFYFNPKKIDYVFPYRVNKKRALKVIDKAIKENLARVRRRGARYV